MATLATLVQNDVVAPIDVALDGGRLLWRELYGYPADGQQNFFVPWLRDILPTMASRVGADDTPEEQVYGLLELYATGEALILGDMYKPLYPHKEGVWEFKTIDTRIFGWFHRRDCFIGVFADDATHIHNHDLHHGYINEVIRLRRELDLDEPKFLAGADPNAVLSVRP
jgi:hypothetical protein